MGLAIFDADVLVGFLNRRDAHHAEATRKVLASIGPETRRRICAVTLGEILVGPVRRGVAHQVHEMLSDLGIEMVAADADLAEAAATVRVSSGLKLPDAFVVATALTSERAAVETVEVLSFDRRVVQAHASMKR